MLFRSMALEDHKNVIDLHRGGRPGIAELPRAERRWSLKIPCLIEADSHGELFRMAFELHLKSSHSIFLSWRDIDLDSRQKPQVLLELTGCTIFIPDITDLPVGEQQTLLQVLQSTNGEKPHFMAGTYVPYADLQKISTLDKQLLETISQAYLKLTKPVAQYRREGLIRYFLESLS